MAFPFLPFLSTYRAADFAAGVKRDKSRHKTEFIAAHLVIQENGRVEREEESVMMLGGRIAPRPRRRASSSLDMRYRRKLDVDQEFGW